MSDQSELLRMNGIDLHWDHLIDQDGTDESIDTAIDQQIADAIQHLYDIDAQPVEDPAFGPRLWEELMELQMQPASVALSPGNTASRPQSNGSVPRSSASRADIALPTTKNTPWIRVAFALLALSLVIALSYGVIQRNDDHKAPVVPAVVPAQQGMHEETLVDVILPAESVGVGVAGSGLGHWIIPVGTSFWTVPQAVQLNYIASGAMTVNSDKSWQLQRSGAVGEWEEIPAGTDAALNAGDSMLLIAPANTDYTNAGPDPVDVIGWILTAGAADGPPMPATWSSGNFQVSGGGALNIATEPARLRLRLIDVPVGEKIDTPDGVHLQYGVILLENDLGTPQPSAWLLASNQSLTNFSDGNLPVYVITFEPAGDGASPEASPSA